MKLKVEKKSTSIFFINEETGKKFDYLTFANDLYEGNKLVITNYSSSITKEERKTISDTVKELNDLSDTKKRKRIISQLDVINNED